MQTTFYKKVEFGKEEREQMFAQLIDLGEREQSMMSTLELTKEKAKHDIKLQESEIKEVQTERTELNSELAKGYRTVSVPCRTFTDQELRKQFIIQTDSVSLLEIRELPEGVQPDLGFDNFSVIQMNREKFNELINDDWDVNPFIEEPLLVTEIETEMKSKFPELPNYHTTYSIYSFGRDNHLRVARLLDNLNYDEMLEEIEAYRAAHPELSEQQEPEVEAEYKKTELDFSKIDYDEEDGEYEEEEDDEWDEDEDESINSFGVAQSEFQGEPSPKLIKEIQEAGQINLTINSAGLSSIGEASPKIAEGFKEAAKKRMKKEVA